MTLFIVDLSDYDHDRGPVDVAAMVRDGMVALTHKATEGTHVQHGWYGAVLNAARAAGLEFLGAYVVVRSGPTVADQVRYLLSYLDAQTPWWRAFPGFFVQVDGEKWSYDQVSAGTVKAFVAELRAREPKMIITYASHGQYGDSLAGMGTPLWNANYPTWRQDLGTCPPAPYRQAYADSGGDTGPGWGSYSGADPVFWQFTDNATIGSQPHCDCSAFTGTIDQLRALITGGSTVSFTPEQEADIYRAVTELTETKSALGVAYVRLATSPGWGLSSLAAKMDADEVRDKALAVAIDGLVTIIKAGGGNVDAASILTAIGTVHDDAKAQFAALHAENAKLRAQVDEYAAREARAAKAEADAFNPPATMAAAAEAPPAPPETPAPLAAGPEADGDPATGSPGTAPTA